MALAFVFPGQGSQFVGMLATQAQRFPVIKATFAEASEVLHYDLWALVSEGPEEKLNQTEYTQPALMAADLALWRLWCELSDQRPTVLAGHSLGEFVAFVCAGSLQFAAAIRLVADRGRFMQEAVAKDEGAMAAIVGLSDAQVCALCEDINDLVAPANFNSKGQVVIAGKRAAVLRAIELSKIAGAKLAKLIPVSVPSHCTLMQPAAEKLAASLAAIEIVSPAIPVIHNVNALSCQDPDTIRRCLIDQLTQPVRWVDTIERMQAMGITDIVECGPGKVLEGLIKRITKEIVLSKGVLDE